MHINAGADDKHKFNGRNKHVQRDRAAERQSVPLERSHVDPQAVARAIHASRNVKELRENLRAAGIEIRLRRRGANEIYAWSLRNIDGPREWTSGSKLTPGNEFGWAKIQAQLDTNLSERQPIDARKFPARVRGVNARKAKNVGQRLDQIADQSNAEALEILQTILSITTRRRPQTAESSSADVPAVGVVSQSGKGAPKPSRPAAKVHRPAPTGRPQARRHNQGNRQA